MSVIKFFIGLAIIAFFGGLALSMAAESYANAGGELRVFSPSAEAIGETAVAIVGNRNHVAISRELAQPDNPAAFRAFASGAGLVMVVAVVLLTLLVLSFRRQAPVEKDWTP